MPFSGGYVIAALRKSTKKKKIKTVVTIITQSYPQQKTSLAPASNRTISMITSSSG